MNAIGSELVEGGSVGVLALGGWYESLMTLDS